jgi:uncharacterized protein
MQSFIDFISQPWPWYVAGPLIGIVIIVLQWIDNKPLAASSSYRLICAATIPAGVPFLKYNWKAQTWNLMFVGGIVIGGFIAEYWLHHPPQIAISSETIKSLQALGIKDFDGYAPSQIFSFASLSTVTGFIIIIIGGFLIGFGSRYAGGCVSGHSMTGISDLQWTSLVTTACIFAGGIFTAYVLVPLILKSGL